jgi:hypothetical protein
MTNVADPSSVWTIVAWTMVIAGAVIGVTMVAGGMLEELPGIVRDGFIRRLKRPS